MIIDMIIFQKCQQSDKENDDQNDDDHNNQTDHDDNSSEVPAIRPRGA